MKKHNKMGMWCLHEAGENYASNEEFVFTVQMVATKSRALRREQPFKTFVYLFSSN
ncbi:hypothetical protein AAJ76_385000297 [Vairimorpha ceranae]|uniref:Uncharacterized protein n=1 Tax=Vairimorpha ceranae TaxID=40302 RepID=A0A0F9W6Z2_9MICR|nr:hypothetical protein AAJ76_385000297 [Vairimorpha ceranae]KKO73611.1 hypothetical protein AAJ76_385000297 [Vairimorpha ceranae]